MPTTNTTRKKQNYLNQNHAQSLEFPEFLRYIKNSFLPIFC